MTEAWNDRNQVPDHCEDCRATLHIITVGFRLLRARAVLACPHCGLAYVEPERRSRRAVPGL